MSELTPEQIRRAAHGLIQQPGVTAALDAALLEVRDAVAAGGPAEGVRLVMEKATPWPPDETAAILGLALVRLVKAEAVEVTW